MYCWLKYQPEPPATEIDFRSGYAVMVTSLIILFAAVPAGGFLAVAYDEEMNLLTQYAAKGLEDSSRKRVRHIKDDYSHPRFTWNHKSDPPLLADRGKEQQGEMLGTALSCLDKYSYEDLYGLTRFGMYPKIMPFVSTCVTEGFNDPTTID